MGSVIPLITQIVVFTVWIVRIDSRTKFLQKKDDEIFERIETLSEKENSDIKQIKSKLYDEIAKELAEVNKKLAVIMDRQDRLE